MPITIDDVFVPVCERRLSGISGVLDKARAYAQDWQRQRGEETATRRKFRIPAECRLPR